MSERWLIFVAWSIIAGCIAVFSVWTWPAVLGVIAIGALIYSLTWSIIFLIVSYDDSPPEPGDHLR